jgi:hypothetical protein
MLASWALIGAALTSVLLLKMTSLVLPAATTLTCRSKAFPLAFVEKTLHPLLLLLVVLRRRTPRRRRRHILA